MVLSVSIYDSVSQKVVISMETLKNVRKIVKTLFLVFSPEYAYNSEHVYCSRLCQYFSAKTAEDAATISLFSFLSFILNGYLQFKLAH